MKKTLLIISALCMSLVASAQFKTASPAKPNFKSKKELEQRLKLLVSKPENSLLSVWDSASNNWFLRRQQEFTYNSMGLVETLITKDSAGLYVSRETLSYNGKNLTEQLVEGYFAGRWINNIRLKIWYNNDQEPVKEINEYWDAATNEWVVFWGFSLTKSFDPILSIETELDSMHNGNEFVLVQKIERHINSNSLVDTEILYFAGPLGVEPMYRQSYAYNAQGLYDSLIQQVWSGSDWMNDRSTTNIEWDLQNGNLMSFITKFWNGTEWEKQYKTIHQYFNYGGVSVTDYAFFNGNLINFSRSEFRNDSLYNQILSKYEDWVGNTWVPNMYETSDYTYDLNSNILVRINKGMDGNGNLVNEIKEEFFNYLELGLNTAKTIEATVYPNPAISNVNIKLGNESTDVLSKVTISSLTGQLLKTEEFNTNTISLNIGDLKSGIYIIRVETNNGIAIKKLKVDINN